MSYRKKTHELIRENEQIVKISQKHDVNLQKNSTLYFQVGLIICLLFTYGLFEMGFETNIPNYVERKSLVDHTYIDIPITKSVKPTLVEPIKQTKVIDPNIFIEVPDDTEDNPFKDDPKDPVVDMNPQLDLSSLISIKEPIEEEPVPFINVEVVPIYPGCENKKRMLTNVNVCLKK